LICRAAIDLTRLVRLGNRVPSGTAMPPNAVFLRLSDGGVYSPEPSAADASGRAVRAFIDAVRAKNEQNGGQHRRGASNGVAVIDRIITEDEEDERLGGGGRSRSPTTASASARAADKKSVVKVDVRAMVAKIENVIEAKSAEEDARDLRDELARRMQTRLGDFGGAAGICKKPAAASMANDDGITADERIVALTNELAEERESLALMKDDVRATHSSSASGGRETRRGERSSGRGGARVERTKWNRKVVPKAAGARRSSLAISGRSR
jgi:hypothetical protein